MNLLQSIIVNYILKLDGNKLSQIFTVVDAFAGGLTDQDALDNVSSAIINHLQTMTEQERIMTLKYIHALKDFREVTV